MSKVGRQRRDLRLDVLAAPIPAKQGANREGVTQVVKPRRGECTRSDSCCVDQLPEGRADDFVEKPFAGARQEKAPKLIDWSAL